MCKIKHCGECDKFLYEDIEGYGYCGKKTTRFVTAETSVT